MQVVARGVARRAHGAVRPTRARHAELVHPLAAGARLWRVARAHDRALVVRAPVARQQRQQQQRVADVGAIGAVERAREAHASRKVVEREGDVRVAAVGGGGRVGDHRREHVLV
eukprot:2643831-Prymnesium_polylepis.1